MKISFWHTKWVVHLTLLIVFQSHVTSAFFGGLFKHRKTINNDAAIFSAVKSAVMKHGEMISRPQVHNRRHPDSDLPDEFTAFEDGSLERPESTRIEMFGPEIFAPNLNKAKNKFNPLSELLSALDKMEQTQSQDEESEIEDDESEIGEYRNPSSGFEITVSSKPKAKRPSGTHEFYDLDENKSVEREPMPNIAYMKSDILSIVEAAKKRKENKNKYSSSGDINKYKPNREISKDSRYSSEGLKPLKLKNERIPLSDMMKSDILSIIKRKKNSSNKKEISSSISDFKEMEIKRPYHSSHFEILGNKQFNMDNDVETHAFSKESSTDLKKSPLQSLFESQQKNRSPSLSSNAERPKDKNNVSLQSFLESQRKRKPFTNLDQLKLKPASKRPSLQSSSYSKNNQRPRLDQHSSKKSSSQSAFKTPKTRRPSVTSMYDALRKKPTLSPVPSEETLFTPKPSLVSMYEDLINKDTLKEPSLLSSDETKVTKTRRPSLSSTYDTLKNRPTLKRPSSLMSSDITQITRKPSIASMYENLRKKPTLNRPSLFPSGGTRHTRRPSFSTAGNRPTLKKPTILSEYETSKNRKPSIASIMDSIRNRPTRKRFSSQSSSDSDNIRRPTNFPQLDKNGRPIRKTTTKTSFPGKDDMKVRVPSRFSATTKTPLTRNTETKDGGNYEVLDLQQSQNKKKVYVTCLLFVCMESTRNILPMSFYKK